jgi:hypothetical protein
VALNTLAQGFAGVLLGKRKGKVLLVSWKRMAIKLRFEDRVDEAMKFSPWKERIALLLEENKIWDIVEKPGLLPQIQHFWRPSMRKM